MIYTRVYESSIPEGVLSGIWEYKSVYYHKKYSFATIITEEGEIKEKERLLNRKESFKEYLHKYEEVVAVVEACWNWPVTVSNNTMCAE